MMLLAQVEAVRLSSPPAEWIVPWYQSTPFWLAVFWFCVPALVVLAFLRFVKPMEQAGVLLCIRWLVRPREWKSLRVMSRQVRLPMGVLLISRTAYDRAALESARAGLTIEPLAVENLRRRVFA